MKGVEAAVFHDVITPVDDSIRTAVQPVLDMNVMGDVDTPIQRGVAEAVGRIVFDGIREDAS